jgi:vacuolar-type H+-ATPase subunit H
MEIKMDELKEKLRRIAELTRDEVGRSEENVKQKIVVPILEYLGHHRNQLDFEYGTGAKRIDIFIRDLPKDCKVIIDTKNYDEDLSSHLEQIGLYAFQEGAILALIVNGEEIRIYDPFFRGFSFRDSLLYSLKRTGLVNDLTVEILYNLLSRENLTSRKVKDFIEKREQEIREAYSKIEEIERKFEQKKGELLDRKERLIEKLDEIQAEIIKVTERITRTNSEKSNEINQVLISVGLSYMGTTPGPQPNGDRVEIVLKNLHTPRKWSLIPLPRECRSFFPGYKISFTLETDIGEITTKVTSAPKGTKIGDPEAGSRLQGGLKPWYDGHGELQEGNKLIIEVIEPKKRYRLSISQ